MERKLAAILAADVVGYSTLMERDEAGTFDRLKAGRKELFEPEIARRHGRVFKLMGDGMLAEFGSVVDAVECAVGLQRGLAERNAACPKASASRCASASISARSSSTATIATGRASTWRRGWSSWPSPAASACRARWRRRSRRSSPSASSRWASSWSRTSTDPVPAFRVVLDGARAPAARPLAVPDQPSLAVLPFTNMSGDPEQEYFADGLVEDLITSLSKIPGMFVIARNSTFAYKDKAVDIRQVAKELGVRYVLEGSVRKAANRLRITGQLVEGTDATHVWADKFEGPLEDVFDLQDRMSESIVGAIEPTIRRAEIERARRKRPDRLDAYDLYLRALPHVYANTPADNEAALRSSRRRWRSTRATRRRMAMPPGAMSSASCAAGSVPRTAQRRWSMRHRDQRPASTIRRRCPSAPSCGPTSRMSTRRRSACSTGRCR